MIKRIMAVSALSGLLIFIGCSKKKETTPVAPETATYVGSDACRTCHADVYAEYVESGHRYGLEKVVNNSSPVYPDSVQSSYSPPNGYSWNDISYIVGGFGWKANYVDHQGYLITGDMVQWNFETQAWGGYNSGIAPGTQSFDCGRCHSTGYEFSETSHQGNLAGIIGTWAEDGVGCEACHGPGGQHVYNPADIRMTVDRSSALCGECHSRTDDHQIAAEYGLITHTGQYDELLGAGHSNIRCSTCHNPHKSTVYDTSALTADCSNCHDITVNHAGPDDCVNCHMPKSVKSAVSSGSGVHLRGDMRSHIFAINTDTTDTQFYVDGGSDYSEGFNGLNFSCLSSCHSSRSLSWAESNAGSIHP